jgi:hypothetical protein
VFGVRSWSAARAAESSNPWDEGDDARARSFQQASIILLASAGAAALVALGSCSYGSWWGRNN